MQFGVILPNFGRLATPDVLTRVAREAEALGYDSLWSTDHVVVPVSQPEPYGVLVEALATLAFLAGRTERVKLGASVIVLPQRNAVIVAKEVAAIDVLSGGRMILGVGAGWSEPEFTWLGAGDAFRRRGRLLDEQVAVLRALWSEGETRFDGVYHHLDNLLFGPKPVQGAALPIWVGGSSPAAIRRATRIGDAWHPVGITPGTYADLARQLEAERGGRAVLRTLRIPLDFAAPAGQESRGASGQRFKLIAGGEAGVTADVEAYKAAGVEHMCIVFPMRSADELVEQMRRFAERVMPRFR